MESTRGRSAVLMLVALALLPAAAAAGERTLLVGVDGSAAAEFLAASVPPFGGALRRCVLDGRVCLVDFAAEPPSGAVGALPGVRWVERDRRMAPTLDDGATRGEGSVRPGPPAWEFPDVAGTAGCPELWELSLVGGTLVWDLADGGGAPVVAIADGGFRGTHRDLVAPLAAQWDYGDGDGTAEVEYDVGVPQHGTFIAGLVAADAGNGVGRAGLAPRGRLFLQKIADSSGAFYVSYAVEAMADLAAHPEVRILSYSLTAGYSTSMDEAVAALGARGVLVVTAAGNCASGPSCWDADNDLHPLYPGNFPGEHIVVVAGTDRDDRWNPWSHYGRTTVDLAAPGVDLCSLGVGSDTATTTASGTSYATPLVAAAAALVWEAHPALTAVEVGRVLRASVHRLPELETRLRSGGRLDVAAAVATGVPRLAAPGELVVDREATLALDVENVGAAGSATLVLYHGPEVELSAEGGWTATPFGAADELDLPDAGRVVAGAAGTLVRGELAAHATPALPLRAVGRSLGTTTASVRLSLASTGASWLNAPYDAGTADPTGFLAYGFAIRVTAVATVDPEVGPDGGEDGGAPDDGVDGDGDAASDVGGDDGSGAEVPADADAGLDAAPDGPASDDGWGRLRVPGGGAVDASGCRLPVRSGRGGPGLRPPCPPRRSAREQLVAAGEDLRAGRRRLDARRAEVARARVVVGATDRQVGQQRAGGLEHGAVLAPLDRAVDAVAAAGDAAQREPAADDHVDRAVHRPAESQRHAGVSVVFRVGHPLVGRLRRQGVVRRVGQVRAEHQVVARLEEPQLAVLLAQRRAAAQAPLPVDGGEGKLGVQQRGAGVVRQLAGLGGDGQRTALGGHRHPQDPGVGDLHLAEQREIDPQGLDAELGPSAGVVGRRHVRPGAGGRIARRHGGGGRQREPEGDQGESELSHRRLLPATRRGPPTRRIAQIRRSRQRRVGVGSVRAPRQRARARGRSAEPARGETACSSSCGFSRAK